MITIKQLIEERKSTKALHTAVQFASSMGQTALKIGRITFYGFHERRRDWREYIEKDNVTIVVHVDVLDGNHTELQPYSPKESSDNTNSTETN